MFTVGSLFVLALLIFLLTKRLQPSILSPTYVLVGTYLLVFIIGSRAYDPAHDGGAARFFTSEAESGLLMVEVTWLLSAFVIGALISLGAGARTRTSRGHVAALPVNRHASSFQAKVSIALATSTIILIFCGNGIEEVFWRTEYLPESNHIAKILGQALMPVAVLASGATFTSRTRAYRNLAVLVAALLLALTLSLCTRLFALVPALFFIGSLVMGNRERSIKRGFALSLLLAPALSLLPLTGRDLPVQGLTQIPEMILAVTETDMAEALHTISNNLFISVPITVASSTTNVEDNVGYVLTGVNPLPGFMTNWDTEQRRINSATPFSAVGDLIRGGMLIAMTYFAAIGLYFGRIDGMISTQKKANPAHFAVLALAFLFTITSLQYPLRNATRMIYYMLLIEALSLITSKLWDTFRELRFRRQHRGRPSWNEMRGVSAAYTHGSTPVKGEGL